MYRIGNEEIEAVREVIENRSLFKVNDSIQSVYNCENELKEVMGSKDAILMTSGKGALISALIGMGVGPGDEVIIPAYTYIATAIAVTAVGAIPVITDIDETLTIDLEDCERKISKYTKVILPVHIQGFPCNMDKITALAKKYNLFVLEDACQSVGGTYNGKMLGTIGDAGAYSFNYFKVLTCGEGGALVTNNHKIFERSLIYHDSSAVAYFGNQLSNVEESLFCGSEYRSNEVSAAILRQQLKRLAGIISDLKKNKDLAEEILKEKFEIIPTNDKNGGCPTTIAISFDSKEKSAEFAAKNNLVRPIETGKHIYQNWTPIMQKRGAFNPAFDPFKMEINKNLNHNYTMDMCKRTIDFLERTVYISVNPDWNSNDVENYTNELMN